MIRLKLNQYIHYSIKGEILLNLQRAEETRQNFNIATFLKEDDIPNLFSKGKCLLGKTLENFIKLNELMKFHKKEYACRLFDEEIKHLNQLLELISKEKYSEMI